ncbi:MAG: glycosyltransferase [Brevinema sp.]
MPTVSVIIPSYNAEKYIQKTIQSILNQTFTDFELIIVDDSTDNTPTLIKSYHDPRIRLILGEKKGGACASNLALKHASGIYIARMDADDFMYPERLQKQADFLNKNLDITCCASNMTTTEGWSVDHSVHSPREIRTRLLFANSICHPTIMWRRAEFEKFGLFYNERLSGCEDYELWLRASEHCDIVNFPECLVEYQIHAGQNSNYLQRDAEIIKQIVPPFIKKHLNIEIPENLKDILVDYSQPHYTQKQLLELYTLVIHILEKIENNSRFCLDTTTTKLSREYYRILSSSLSPVEIYFFIKKLQKKKLLDKKMPLSLNQPLSKEIIKYYCKTYIPMPIFKFMRKIYQKIKNRG